jgi:hypothetical protein
VVLSVFGQWYAPSRAVFVASFSPSCSLRASLGCHRRIQLPCHRLTDRLETADRAKQLKKTRRDGQLRFTRRNRLGVRDRPVPRRLRTLGGDACPEGAPRNRLRRSSERDSDREGVGRGAAASDRWRRRPAPKRWPPAAKIFSSGRGLLSTMRHRPRPCWHERWVQPSPHTGALQHGMWVCGLETAGSRGDRAT